MTPNRSFLFTPGNHARRVEKALGIGADAVILDLEDAVAVAEKATARDTVVAALEQARNGRAYVRVNGIATEFCFDDLAAVVGPKLDGIVLPMAESAADVKTIDWTLGNLERRAGLPVGGLDLMPIIETAAGLAAAREICAAGTRVKRIAFGAGDYTRDLDLVWTLKENEIAAARAELVLAAILDAPVAQALQRFAADRLDQVQCRLLLSRQVRAALADEPLERAQVGADQLLDGVEVGASTVNEMTQGDVLSVTNGEQVHIGNTLSEGRSIEGVIYYAGLYNVALSELEIEGNADVLLVDDDTP